MLGTEALTRFGFYLCGVMGRGTFAVVYLSGPSFLNSILCLHLILLLFWLAVPGLRASINCFCSDRRKKRTSVNEELRNFFVFFECDYDGCGCLRLFGGRLEESVFHIARAALRARVH